MGQKVHPIGIRLGYWLNSTLRCGTQEGRTYADYLNTDLKLLEYVSDQN